MTERDVDGRREDSLGRPIDSVNKMHEYSDGDSIISAGMHVDQLSMDCYDPKDGAGNSKLFDQSV